MVWSYYSNLAHGSTYTDSAYGHVVDFEQDTSGDYRAGIVRVTERSGRSYLAKRCTYDGHLHHESEVGYKDKNGNWFSSWQNMMAYKDPALESMYSATNTDIKYAAKRRQSDKRRQKKRMEYEEKTKNTEKNTKT